MLATALLAGSVGGAVGVRVSDRAPSDERASFQGGSAPQTTERSGQSVAGIAARVIRSTVSITVQGGGSGSGIVLRSDGFILTNNHVVAPAADGGEITVSLDAGEQQRPAKVVGRDPVTDLAVLRVDSPTPLAAARLGDSRTLTVGEPAIAIGSPLGLSGTVTTGIISALNRTVDVPGADGNRNPLYNAIQTDAAVNPGNSGGALVNARGQVVGINSAIATLSGGASGGSIGLGFAIPIDEASSVADQIIRTGRATHPSIAVFAVTVTGPDDREGALIRALKPGGAADLAGLQMNDLIVKVDGSAVESVEELITTVRGRKIGDTVTITYLRDEKVRTAQVVLQDLGS